MTAGMPSTPLRLKFLAKSQTQSRSAVSDGTNNVVFTTIIRVAFADLVTASEPTDVCVDERTAVWTWASIIIDKKIRTREDEDGSRREPV